MSAGLSQPSSTRLLADRLTEATSAELAASGTEVTVDVIELRDLAHQITDNMLTGFPPPELAEAIGKLLAADGVIAVTPIFSASYSGLFKSFFDVIEKDALTRKAVLLGATGGTARHSLSLEHALRPALRIPACNNDADGGFRGLGGLGPSRPGPHRARRAHRTRRS